MLYKIVIGLVRGIIWLLYRYRVRGVEHIPPSGPYIVCANHQTLLDVFFLAASLKHEQVHFMGKEELFKSRFMNWFLHGVGAFPVSRGKGDLGAVQQAIRLIGEGKIFGIFPEGTRNQGHPITPKAGIGLIAGETGASVLPAGISYGKGRPTFRGTVTVEFGPVITPEEIAYTGRTPSEFKRVSRLIMERILRHAVYPEMKNPHQTKRA